jgi:hypothetical protein
LFASKRALLSVKRRYYVGYKVIPYYLANTLWLP